MKALLFDFDGTIINTNTLIREGLNDFAERYRGCALAEAEHRLLTGKPLEDQMRYINESKWELMTNHFKIWYKHHHNDKTCAFPGIVRMLETLRERGIRLGIVSNNSRESVAMGLEHLGLKDFFEHIITKDDVTQTKPAPEGILKAMSLMGLESSEVMYIGDTAGDIHAAKHAGISNAIVGWSSIGHETMMLLQPDYVLQVPSQLLQIIREHNSEVA